MALSSFAGGRLWGARFGDRPPGVLALHGWARSHADFAPVLDGFDAVALDLAGFGVAPEPSEPWPTERYATEVAPVLADMGPGPLVVLGHSFGARVGVHLAAAHPDRVRSLVLTGAPLAPFPGAGSAKPALVYRAGRALHRRRLLSDARMEALRHRHGSQDYRQATPVMRGVLVKSVGETASCAYAPVLTAWAAGGGRLALVWGEDDGVASLEGTLSSLAQAGVAPAEKTVVAGAGHLLGPSMYGALREALARALGHERPGPGSQDAGQSEPAQGRPS